MRLHRLEVMDLQDFHNKRSEPIMHALPAAAEIEGRAIMEPLQERRVLVQVSMYLTEFAHEIKGVHDVFKY